MAASQQGRVQIAKELEQDAKELQKSILADLFADFGLCGVTRSMAVSTIAFACLPLVYKLCWGCLPLVYKMSPLVCIPIAAIKPVQPDVC